MRTVLKEEAESVESISLFAYKKKRYIKNKHERESGLLFKNSNTNQVDI